MVEMARRMDAEPTVGLIQTLPKVINAKTWFGRSMQFASWFFAPSFSRGLAAVQGTAGTFWGHNAIVRTEAFAATCGLPKLSGNPPFGGDILSHDYVEAALLSSGGWKLRLYTDLEGSYEEAPDDLIAYGAAYARSETGAVLRSGRPESLRHAIVGRFPTHLAFPQTDLEDAAE